MTRAIPRAGFVVAILALTVRIAFVAATPGYEPKFDAFDYSRHADSIAAGDGLPGSLIVPEGRNQPTALRPPLYPYLLAGVYKLAPGSITAGRLTSALLGAVAVLLIFLIADRIWGRRVALVTGVLAAVYPPLVVMGGALLVEPLYLPLALGAVLAILEYGRSGGRLRFALLTGLLIGLGTLTRSNGFLIAIPALLGLYLERPAAANGRSRLTAPALATAVVIATVAPWMARNAIEFDRVVPPNTSPGHTLRGTYNEVARRGEEKWSWKPPEGDLANRSIYLDPANDEADITSKLMAKAIDFIEANPGSVPEATLLNGIRLFHPHAADDQRSVYYAEIGVPRRLRGVVTGVYYAMALLALIGIVALLTNRIRPGGPLWLWLFPAVTALGTAVVLVGTGRYRAPIDPFIAMLAAIGLVAVLDRRSRQAT